MSPATSTATRARLAVVAEMAAVAAGYLVGLVSLCQRLAGRTVFPEDLEWITGEVLGSPLRLTQHVVLNRLSLPLFEDDLGAYFIPGVVLHLATAAAIHMLFVLVCGTLRCGLQGARAVRAGGAAAGVLFLLGQPAVVIYPSALSYQLVTLAVVATLIFAVLFFRSGRLIYWAALVLCYGVALFSHSYAVGLPLMVLALEVAWLRTGIAGREDGKEKDSREKDKEEEGEEDARGEDAGGRSPERWRGLVPGRGALLRYLAFALPVGAMAWRLGEALPRIEASISTYRTQEMGPWLVLYFARYLTEVLLRFGQDVFGWTALAQLHRAGPDLYAADVFALVGWSVVGVLGLRELLRRRTTVGMAGMALLFFLGWNGLCLVQTYLTSDYFAQWWRFYFNAAGLSVALVHVLLRGAGALGRLARAPGWLPAWIAAVGVVVACTITRPAGVVHPMAWARKTTEYSDVPRYAGGGGKNMRQASLRKRAMARADLRRADLFRADLSGADLGGASMAGASLLLADLRQAGLAGADLSGAFLVHARLTGASLERARLRGANLEGATLTAARLGRADLTAAHLSWATMEDADLGRASLRRANLRGARLGRANLGGADLRGAYLEGADLRRADLRGADLRGAHLGGAKLEETRLGGARLCSDSRPSPPSYKGTPRWDNCHRRE